MRVISKTIRQSISEVVNKNERVDLWHRLLVNNPYDVDLFTYLVRLKYQYLRNLLHNIDYDL